MRAETGEEEGERMERERKIRGESSRAREEGLMERGRNRVRGDKGRRQRGKGGRRGTWRKVKRQRNQVERKESTGEGEKVEGEEEGERDREGTDKEKGAER